MRSSGTPSRIASTTPRTIARTSSSGSEAFHTSVPVTGAIAAAGPAGTSDPSRCRLDDDFGVGGRRARDRGDDLDVGVFGERAQQPRLGRGQPLRQEHDDRAQSTGERAPGAGRVGGGAHQVVLVVPLAFEQRLRRAVQAHDLCGAADAARRAGRAARRRGRPAPGARRRALPRSPGARATGANRPALRASARRTAAATTGVDTGRRPAAASVAAPSSSARRYTVRNVTPTTPRPAPVTAPSSPDASRRRAETPTEFVGTTTVTGASASAVSRAPPRRATPARRGARTRSGRR